MFRQGEIILKPTSNLNTKSIGVGLAARKLTTKVIREGEATGNFHAVNDQGTLYQVNGTMYLRAEAGTKLTHQEHATINIPKGDYEVTIQREYDEEKDSKEVVD